MVSTEKTVSYLENDIFIPVNFILVSNPNDASSKNITSGIIAHSLSSGPSHSDATLVHKLFEGTLTSETRCLTCETVCFCAVHCDTTLYSMSGFMSR